MYTNNPKHALEIVQLYKLKWLSDNDVSEDIKQIELWKQIWNSVKDNTLCEQIETNTDA